MKILVPLDGSKLGESALLYLENFLQILKPEQKTEITLLHVLTPSYRAEHAGNIQLTNPTAAQQEELAVMKKEATKYLNGAAKRLKSKGASVICTIKVRDALLSEAAEIIDNAERETHADLIVMSTHGRHGVKRWALGSIADKVVREGNIPVLLIRAKNSASNT